MERNPICASSRISSADGCPPTLTCSSSFLVFIECRQPNRCRGLRKLARLAQSPHAASLNKLRLIEEIITALEAELANYARSARAAHAEATDEQSKAENKYDTRGLEASYLARGQSRQAAE